MQGRKAELLEKESALKLRKDEVEHDIKRIEDSNKKIASEIADLKLYLNTLEKENEFIRSDKDQFGQAGSDEYDFSRLNVNDLKKRYHNTVQE